MDERDTSSRASQDSTPNQPHQEIATVILCLVGLVIAARVAMMLFSGPAVSLPKTPGQGAATGVAVSTATLARTPVPSPTWTPSPTPTVTPSPSPTPEPLRLAVEQSVLDSYQSYFAHLPSQYEGLEVLACPGREEVEAALAEHKAGWGIHWAGRAPGTPGTQLRGEPYAVAVHPAFAGESFGVSQLVALAEGRDTTLKLVTGDGGRVARDLLNLTGLAASAIHVADWLAAKEYVATHEGTWALLPWEVVDFRVRTVAVDGQRLDPRKIENYPLVHQLELRGAAALPRALSDDLQQALRYQPPATVELVAVGDIMLDRFLTGLLQQNSMRYPFQGAGIQPLLSQADIAIGNLECAISDRGTRQPKTYTFRADPKVVEGLTFAGMDVLSLANNHAGDYGDPALVDTLDLVRSAGIATVGAGMNITEAHEAKIVEANGLRVAFLAYNQISPASFAATATSPGTAFMDRQRMAAEVRTARERADLVVVSCHWGTEYSAYPNASQKELAQALADAGADLVIGHHPHVVQGLRFDRQTFTVYSLGNFVFDFDSDFSRQTTEGVVMHCLLDRSGVKTVELLPYSIVGYRPNLVSREEGALVLQTIAKVTRSQGSFPKEVVPQ